MVHRRTNWSFFLAKATGRRSHVGNQSLTLGQFLAQVGHGPFTLEKGMSYLESLVEATESIYSFILRVKCFGFLF